MPISRLLIGVGDFKEGFFAEGLADNLHTYRQAIGKAGRYRNRRYAGDVYRQGTDITQIHLQRVIRLLPDFEWGGGGGGGYQGVIFLKGLVKLLPDDGAYLLGLDVIGIIVAGG